MSPQTVDETREDYLVTDTPAMPNITISRRTSIQLALAAVLAGRALGTARPAGAQESPGDTWNWGGNVGHTGELPGPGLSLDAPLGELWRVPEGEIGQEFAGYANGVIYTWNGDSLWARRLHDGEFLWAQNPAKLRPVGTPTTALVSSPPASPAAEDVAFADVRRGFAIDGDLIVTTMSNGEVWGLDASSGALRWTFDQAPHFRLATVVDHVAYGTATYGPDGEGVVAVSLGGQPQLQWLAEIPGTVVGVESGYVFVLSGQYSRGEVRALTADTGLEYWRWQPESTQDLWEFFGTMPEGILVRIGDAQGEPILSSLNLSGQIAWTAPGQFQQAWIAGDTITTLYARGYDDLIQIIAYRTQNGQPLWDMRDSSGRWSYYHQPVVCDGNAYVLLYDRFSSTDVLFVINPIAATVHELRNTSLRPRFVVNGVMIAEDTETSEFVAIGAASGVVQAGGRAALTEDAALRGAPNEVAIERAQLGQGAVVEVTGNPERSGATEWVPVHDPDSGQSGWLPTDVLQGQDGTIRFDPIPLDQLGTFEVFPAYGVNTQAEVTGESALHGAPSATSVEKSQLPAGTLVTITSAPTNTDGETWYAVAVEETGETGWLPESALTLAP